MENQFVCQYCGKDTSKVEYDYLSGYDHLGCALEAEMSKDGYDTCVLCGVETSYKRSTHIDYRIGYIEGAGQLCKECYDKGTDRNNILIPESVIYNTPNDQELGGKIRQIYWQTKNILP